MSRAINLPSQSVKLTNVAIVRLTVQNKRFEIACYKNKVLDYRNGLETDLSEVLQTSNIHIFTNVTKGQFASSTDCISAFGPIKGKSQEEMAIHILLHGKSIQVSEMERQQLYDTTLLQIATQIATTCINPNTGIPYTTSQIKQALTTSTTSSSTTTSNHTTTTTTTNDMNRPNENTKKKSKKNSKKHNSNTSTTTSVSSTVFTDQQQHFVIQPHKPIKQQYLQAIKYLQYNHIIPIVRASMELIWHYPTQYDPMVLQILQDLHIPTEVLSSDTLIATNVTDQANHTNITDNTSIKTNNTTTTLNESVDAMATLNLEEKGNVPSTGNNPTTTTINTTTTTSTTTTTCTTDSSDNIMSRTMIVDPSLYRILQDYTPIHESNHGSSSNPTTNNPVPSRSSSVVPHSRIEILRQQVFQKPISSLPPSSTSTSTLIPTSHVVLQNDTNFTARNDDEDRSSDDVDVDDDDDDDNNDNDDDDLEQGHDQLQQKQSLLFRKQNHAQLLFDDDDDDNDDDDHDDDDKKVNDKMDKSKNHGITESTEVDKDSDGSEDDSDESPPQLRGRNKKGTDKKNKKKKKKHLQLVQSQMIDVTDVVDTAVVFGNGETSIISKAGHKNNKKSQKNSQQHQEHSNHSNATAAAAAATTTTTTSAAAEFLGSNSTATTNTTNGHNITTSSRSTAETPLYTCNTCIGIENAFHTTAEYRAHYRSDWHRYNQKLKSCQATPISYSEFITCDAQSFFDSSTNDDF